MAGDDIDQIRQRLDIVDFINSYVLLKKAGRNFKALCPFHSEKTPSFVVSPERQIWHCFGCQKGGDVFTFLMEFEKLEFGEVLRMLAEKTGVKLSFRPETSEKGRLKERLLALHQLASEYYHYILGKHRLGESGRLYLRDRGISDKIIRGFGIGYAPQAWENLTKYLRKKGFADKELLLAGVVVSGRGGIYDRFRGRIIFPIRNHRGQIIAFSGRSLSQDVKEAKYINSPETPIYIKGETVFGLDMTKETIKKEKSVVVVEGEFDLLSSFQAGVSNIVAIKGSALTEAQVKLLKRFTEKIILALDPDQAGDAAARRGIETADKEGFDIQAVILPTGKDPDIVVRENVGMWKQAIKGAVPFYDFLIDSALNRHNRHEAFGKKKITDEILPVLGRIDNPIVQAHYLRRLAQVLDTAEDRLIEALNKIKIKMPVDTRSVKQVVVATPKTHEELLEEHLLALVLQAADKNQALVQIATPLNLADFTNLAVKKILQALSVMGKQSIQVNQWAQSLPKELLVTFDRLYLTDLSAFVQPELFQQELDQTILAIQKTRLRAQIKTLTDQIKQKEKQGDEEAVKQLTLELQQLTIAWQNLISKTT